MKFTLIHWRDAAHSISEVSVSETGLVDLYELGFVVAEDNEKVTLSMEVEDLTGPPPETARLWLSIPKVNIVTRVDKDIRRAFPNKKKVTVEPEPSH